MRRLLAILITLIGLLAVAPAALADSPTVRADKIAAAGYPEGPLWHNGRLFYVEYGTSRIMVIDHPNSGRAHPRQFWRQDGCGASGLIALPGDRLLVTCYDNNTLAVVDRHGHRVGVLSHDSLGRPFVGPNDFTRDRAGGIYFTASGVYAADAPATGMVYYLAPSGGIWPVARHIDYSNGLAVTPDGRQLLVAAMLSHEVLRYDILPGGRLAHRRVLARTDRIDPPASTAGPLSGPDGMKIGPDGLLYIAQNGSGRILVVDWQHRRLVRTITTAAPYLTNVAFGPGRAVYLTASFDPDHPPYPGAVYVARR